jgi:DNA repair exonuclease SbcCD nuclease subunit
LDAFRQLRRLRCELPESPVVVIAGNHDTPRSAETGSILKLFEAIDGVFVIATETRELLFEQLGVRVVCVPHSALGAGPEAIPNPPDDGLRNVLVMHGEITGILNRDTAVIDYGGVTFDPDDLHAERWDYIALGHYHVAREVTANAWYCGSLDYVSTNAWGELVDEEAEGRRGEKGWLLVHLEDTLQVEFRAVTLERRVLDLEPIDGDGLGAAELDRLISERVALVPGGVTDDVVRQLVFDVPRPVVRDLDHRRIREIKADALHYNLDIRRPTASRKVGVGAPGKRQTLTELVEEYLTRRQLSDDVDRDLLLQLGFKYMAEVERDLLEE